MPVALLVKNNTVIAELERLSDVLFYVPISVRLENETKNVYCHDKCCTWSYNKDQFSDAEAIMSFIRNRGIEKTNPDYKLYYLLR